MSATRYCCFDGMMPIIIMKHERWIARDAVLSFIQFVNVPSLQGFKPITAECVVKSSIQATLLCRQNNKEYAMTWGLGPPTSIG